MISTNVEPARQFVDTSILLYAYDSSAGDEYRRAARLIMDLWIAGAGCLSIQVLQEFYVVASRKAPNAQPHELVPAVRDYARWQIHTPQAADVLAAIDLHLRHQISFWDAMIVHSAHALGCAILWSEDLNHSQVLAGVTVRNPFV